MLIALFKLFQMCSIVEKNIKFIQRYSFFEYKYKLAVLWRLVALK